MSDLTSIKVLIISGPTSTGKTKLADILAQKFNGELISADSRQVYKGLDIVTGKDLPTSKIYGYDLVAPNEEWNASLFRDFALKTISHLQTENKLPIIVGGTGLYVKALLTDFNSPPPNPNLRSKLEKLSVTKLQEKLKKINFKRFHEMNHSDQNNPRRLIRAIEITSSAVKNERVTKIKLNPLIIGLMAPRTLLSKKIQDRVKKRLLKNPQNELNYLETFDLSSQSSSVTSLGYKELAEYYQGKITKEELINKWSLHERQYAKRQMTWFKKEPNIHWFDVSLPGYKDRVVDLVTTWYTKSN